MYHPKMELTNDQQAILNGEKGPTLAKIMETIVRYGDIFDAKRLIKVTHGQGHLVTSFGIPLLKPVYKTMDEIIKSGLSVK